MKLAREFFLLLAAAGLFGYLACGAVNALALWRLDDFNLARAADDRHVLLKVKNLSGYVEQSYAERLHQADDYANLFWLLSIPGFLGFVLLRKSS